MDRRYIRLAPLLGSSLWQIAGLSPHKQVACTPNTNIMPGSLPGFHLALCHKDQPPSLPPPQSSVTTNVGSGICLSPSSPTRASPSPAKASSSLTQPPAWASLLTASLASLKALSAPGPSSRHESHLALTSALAVGHGKYPEADLGRGVGVYPQFGMSLCLTHQASGSVPLPSNGPLRSLPTPTPTGWLVLPVSPALFPLTLGPSSSRVRKC